MSIVQGGGGEGLSPLFPWMLKKTMMKAAPTLHQVERRNGSFIFFMMYNIKKI